MLKILSEILVFLVAFFLIVFLMFGAFIGLGQKSNASQYRTQVITAIENSNYNASVINAVLAKAEENGYEMAITVYTTDGSTKTYTDATATEDELMYATMADIELSYEYNIPIIGVLEGDTISGNAR